MSRILCRLVGAIVPALVATCACSAAEPFLASMSPQAVVRGGTTRVVLSGTGLGKPIDLWTSLDRTIVQAKQAAGSAGGPIAFDVTVADDAPLGLYGLRLATDDGLTNAIVFLIDELSPERAEARSAERGVRSDRTDADAVSNSSTQPALRLPISIHGTFRPTEIDRFTIEAAAGEEIGFECVASRFGKDADPLLSIRDASGKLLFEHDNDPGLFFDFRTSYRFDRAGRYTVELCDQRFHGADDWQYVFRIGRFPAARIALPSVVKPGATTLVRLPELGGAEASLAMKSNTATKPDAAPSRGYAELRRPGDTAATWVAAAVSTLDAVVEQEPNDTLEQAAKLAAPVVVCGLLDRPEDVDYFELELKKGDRLAVRAETSLLDSAADVELIVFAPEGREMSRVDDVLTDEANLVVVANKDGPYRLRVHDVTRGGGPAFGYRLEIVKAGPQLALTADFSAITVPQGEWQSLPIIVTRTEFKGPVQLALVGAPPGVTLEPTTVPEETTTLWARLRADTKSPLGLATLQVVGTAEVGGAKTETGEQSEKLSAVARTQPLLDRERFNVDLIKYGLRENQRRLPPSMCDRIALQVTPPAPFSADLPDATVTLVRYLTREFPIHVTRRPGFVDELSFKAVGGQLGEENEIRRQIYTRFSSAGPSDAIVRGTFFSRNLPQERKERVDLSIVGEAAGRRTTLVRSFDLELKAGYKVVPEPKAVTIAPGESQKIRLIVERLPPFDGPVTIEPTEIAGLNLPETITIAAGESTADFTVVVPADMATTKQNTRLFCKAQVGAFQEEGTPIPISFDIKLPPKPAAKPADKNPKQK